MRWIAITLVLLASNARADSIDCENHDRAADLKPEQILSCRHRDHAKIRAAARRFCAKVKPAPEQDKAGVRGGSTGVHCERVRPLLARCRCPIELHRAGAKPYAWLGGDPAHDELYWGVGLVVTKRGWTVTDLFYDDYERP